MIKFFRKIRQKLLSENKFSKYLFYALGEIVLVVIGILIALQINNWNQNRLERNEEKIVLRNLKEDFRSAIEEFQGLNAIRDQIISTGSIIYEMGIENVESYPLNHLDSLISKTMNAPTFNNQSGSLNVLLTSGKIDLISNQDLKEKLIEWPGDVEDMIEDEVKHSELYAINYSNILDNYVSWNDVFGFRSNTAVRFKSESVKKMKPNTIIESDYKALLSDKVFLNVLNRRLIYLSFTKSETEVLIAKAKDITNAIDKELSYD